MSRRWPAVVEYNADADRGAIAYHNSRIYQEVQFQHGPTGDTPEGLNGVMNEEVIQLLVVRLKALNERFPCRENALAITNLQQAQFWLEHRQDLRLEQGVYGKNEAHTS